MELVIDLGCLTGSVADRDGVRQSFARLRDAVGGLAGFNWRCLLDGDQWSLHGCFDTVIRVAWYAIARRIDIVSHEIADLRNACRNRIIHHDRDLQRLRCTTCNWIVQCDHAVCWTCSICDAVRAHGDVGASDADEFGVSRNDFMELMVNRARLACSVTYGDGVCQRFTRLGKTIRSRASFNWCGFFDGNFRTCDWNFDAMVRVRWDAIARRCVRVGDQVADLRNVRRNWIAHLHCQNNRRIIRITATENRFRYCDQAVFRTGIACRTSAHRCISADAHELRIRRQHVVERVVR